MFIFFIKTSLTDFDFSTIKNGSYFYPYKNNLGNISTQLIGKQHQPMWHFKFS